MQGTLLAAAAASAVAGGAFALVGLRVRVGGTTASFAAARAAHATWWLCLGGYLVLQAALTAMAAFDALSPGTYLASRALAIPLLCVGVWGLCTYLAFLHGGSLRPGIVFAVLYAVIAVVFAYATFGETPNLVVTDWLVGYSSTLYQTVYALVGLPPIVASIAYLALLPRVQEPVQRRRLVLTSVGIMTYIASGLAARLAGSDAVAFITLVPMGLVAAGVVLAAHWVQTPPVSPTASPDDAGMARRLRELV